MAFAELKNSRSSVGDDSYDLLTGTHEGISFSPTDKYNTELTRCPTLSSEDYRVGNDTP